MTDHQRLADVAALRDELTEARRYVRTRPALAANAVYRFIDRLQDHRLTNGTIDAHAARWACNLTEGIRWQVVAPKVCEGYIDGTAWELFVVQEAIRKELDLERTDRPFLPQPSI